MNTRLETLSTNIENSRLSFYFQISPQYTLSDNLKYSVKNVKRTVVGPNSQTKFMDQVNLINKLII